MIELIATAESIEQAEALINVGIDTLYVGEDRFGLRLPASFSQAELKEITDLAHRNQKKVCVAMNAIMHNDRIKLVLPYMEFLQDIGVNSITVGDPGVIHLLKTNQLNLSYIYDPHTMITSGKQVNFWANRGAVGAVLARELTYEELTAIAAEAMVPVEVLVYGATCIHHSKRPLVTNYFNFTKVQRTENNDLYLSEPKKPDTHYSIYEDTNGTHIFNTGDINLLPHLETLYHANLKRWKLDGIFTPRESFVQIASLFIKAKEALINDNWSPSLIESLNEQILKLHPQQRSLDEGFFLKDPDEIK
ncbi:peptidase U32 family protein [Cerasibacillus sp. JNUCC 74]